MRLEITGRHVTVTPALRRLVERKLTKLGRLLNDEAVSAQVVLSEAPLARRVDITLHARGEHFLHSGAESPTWNEATVRAVDRLVQQARKVKGRWQERKRPTRASIPPRSETITPARPRGQSREPAVTPRVPPIFRSIRVVVRTMSVVDAVNAMRKAGGAGDAPVVFRDRETDSVSVLFRRADGELVLLVTAG